MKRVIVVSFVLCLLAFFPAAGDGLNFEQIAAIRGVGSVELSPDGTLIAYGLSVPRRPGHKPRLTQKKRLNKQ